MSGREILNRSVKGGHARPDVSRAYTNDIGTHTTGRLDAMAEILIQAAFLRSAGMLPSDTKPVSSAGAKFQDFRNPGSLTHVMAHRATLTVTVGGRNFADLVGSHLKLREMLIAPQARTDPLHKALNYADLLFEFASKEATMRVFQHVMRTHTPGKPVNEKELTAAIQQLREAYITAYGKAMERAGDLMQAKGLEFDRFLKDMKDKPDVGAAIADEIEFTLAQGGPAQFAEAPVIALGMAKDVAVHSTTDLILPDNVAKESETLAKAAEEPPAGGGEQPPGPGAASSSE